MRRAIVAVLLLLVVVGCGGSDTTVGTIEVTATEFEFRPTGIVAATGETEVALTNSGSILHEWVVLSETIENESDLDDGLVLFRLEADAGATRRGTIDIPAGTYQVICGIGGHFNAGMEGTLVVSDG